jgi:hypothetical protein
VTAISPLILIAGVLAVLVGGDYYLYRANGRRRWNPLWMAFTLTALALLYAGGGLLGYSVPTHNPIIEQRAIWIGHVVWPQVAFGSIFGLASIFFWRVGLKRL